MPTLKAKIAASAGTFFAITGTYPFYEKSIFNSTGPTMIPDLQAGIDQAEANRITFYSDWIEYMLQYGPVIFFVLKTNQRPRAFYYIILISFVVITNNLLKVVYKIPRPFWIFADVKAYACQKGFGSPSGHTMIAWAMPIAMALDIRRSNPSGKVMIIISFVITLCLGLFEMWTRMVLGVHTIDQVMIGAAIGIWMAFTFEYIIKKPLIKHVMQINQNKLEELLPLKKLFLYSSLLSLGFLAFELFLYGIIFWPNWYFVAPLEYNQMISWKCASYASLGYNQTNPWQPTDPRLGYTYAKFEVPQFGEIGLPWGSYFGLLIQTHYFKGRMHFKGPTQKKALKVLARLFFVLLSLAIPQVPAKLIDIDDWLWLQLVVKVFIPSAILGILVFGFLDEAFFKMKLYDPDQRNAEILNTSTDGDDPFKEFRVNMSERGSSQPYTKRDILAGLNGSKDS